MSLDIVLLRDEYDDSRAAGAVNNTPATDGQNTRRVTDAFPYLSLSGGLLSIAGTVSVGNPILSYGAAFARTPGMVMISHVPTLPASLVMGYANALLGTANETFFVLSSTALNAKMGSSGVTVFSPLSFPTKFAIATRATGEFFFTTISGKWCLVGEDKTHATANLYAALYTGSGTAASDKHVIAGYWLPAPLVSDGFSANGPTDGLGHAETSGLGSGGGGVTWNGATWSVSVGKAINTPTLNAELLTNGGMEGPYTGGVASGWSANGTVTASENTSDVHGGTSAQQLSNSSNTTNSISKAGLVAANKWYAFSAYAKRVSGSGSAFIFMNGSSSTTSNATYTLILGTSRATSAHTFFLAGNNATGVFLFDDVSVREITLSSLLSLHASPTPDVFVGADLIVTAGTQAGVALNWDSTSAPTNGIIAYHDGTNCKLEKCVAGVWTTVVSAAATYSANARIIVSKIGTAYRLYYNNALVGSGTISDAGIINNTLHGRFLTDPSSNLDNYTCYASGSGGEYNSSLQIVISGTQTSVLNISAAIATLMQKAVASAINLSESIGRMTFRSQAGQFLLSSSVGKIVVRAVASVISLSDNIAKMVLKAQAAQLMLDSMAAKTIFRAISGAFVLSNSTVSKYGKKIIRTIRLLASRGAK